MPAIFDPHLMFHEKPKPNASLGFLSEQAPQAVISHLQGSCHAKGSGTLPGEGRRQQLTCEAGCEEITTGHVFDGHARLTLQKTGHKLRLELLSGSWERRASCSTHWGSLVERRNVRYVLENLDEPLSTGLAVLPTPWTGQ